MSCTSPLGARERADGTLSFRRHMRGKPDYWIPCGKCTGCRLDYSKEMTARIMHEQLTSSSSCWLTLTLSDEHLTFNSPFADAPTLAKSDWQDFAKSLRHRIGPFRYYMCGEYGERKGRPHYHACIFGIDPADKKPKYLTEQGHQVFSSERITDAWGKGIVDVSALEQQNAAYTARYTTKKIYGEKAIEHYKRYDDYGVPYWLEPEFALMSTGDKDHGGLGFDYYLEHAEQIIELDYVYVNGHKQSVPRYYDKLTERFHPEAYERLKKRRREAIDIDDPEFSTPRRASRAKVNEAILDRLTRPLED